MENRGEYDMDIFTPMDITSYRIHIKWHILGYGVYIV